MYFPLIAVGVGPGDPELLTLKGRRSIREADVVITPVADLESSSVALSIIRELIDSSRQEVIPQVYPMRREGDDLTDLWAASAAQIGDRIREGRRVVFVTLGDPSLYSTFQYVHRMLEISFPDIPVEIVPGISSVHAAAALARVSLGLGDDGLAILPATGDRKRLREALNSFETVVLMKVHRTFPEIRDLLRACGRLEQAVLVRRAGLPEEKVFFDLDCVASDELDYLSLVIVS